MRPLITDTLRRLAAFPVLLALMMAVPLQAQAGGDSRADCTECSEKVVTVMLRYEGSAPARVVVRSDKGSASDRIVYFDGILSPGQLFAFSGDESADSGDSGKSKKSSKGNNGEFDSNNLHIVVLDPNDTTDASSAGGSDDSDVNVIAFHVSCSQPIVMGMDAAQQDEWDDGDENDSVTNDPDAGLFFVAGAVEKNGGTLCASEGDDDETCKLEGSDIGTSNVTVQVDGETVTIVSWIQKDGEPGEYVGFTLDKVVNNAVVKAGNMLYPFSGNSWTNPNGTSGPTAKAISNIDFCGATVPGGDGRVDECTPDIDFDTDANGQALAPGTIITNQYAAWGMTVSTNNPQKPAMLFNSANPTGGDSDLGAPNADFGGPGVGNGGGLNQPGANDTALGNVLIISEDGDSNDPDDNANGGTLIFEFDQDTNLEEVHILDVDNVEVAGIVTAYDVNNNVIESHQILALGDNSIQVVPFSATGVRKITVELPGSGAVTRIVTCTEDPAPLGSIGDTVFEDTNGNGVQDGGEAGIPGVDVKLYTNGGQQLVEVATTDANGHYLFDALPAGDYSVDVVDATVPAGLNLTTNNDPEQVTLTAGEDFLDADFGYRPHVSPGTDIKVQKSSSQASVDLGDTFTYTLTASNVGSGDATGVVLTDTLPYGVAFVSASPAAGVAYDSNTHTITWTVGSLAAGASTQIIVTVEVDWMTGTFTGGFLQDGVYKLQNHPDGAVNPPFYGLRLDKLFGGLGPITFDFEHAQSDMRMRIENGGQTIVIYGQSWGGRDNGTSFDFAGVWDVQFIFDGTVTPVPGDDDLLVTAESDRGTIIPRYTTSHFSANQVFELAPKFANGLSFRLGNEDNDSGHRGFDGISGWGWIQHNGNGTLSHKPTSDWLFTAHPAPDAFENCVELSGINETDANAANNEACVTTPPVDPGANSLSGTVFIDANQDGFLSGGESGQSGVTVNVYRDTNGNGSRDAGEPLFATTVTAGDGTYSVAVPTVGHFVIETDFPGSYPANATLTTDNVEIAFFAGFGLSDTGNDFGFFATGGGDPDIKVEKSSSEASVELGDTFTYTLTARNVGSGNATGVVLTDTLPYGVAFVSASPAAGVAYDSNTHTITWTVGSLAAGASTQITVTVTVDWMTGTFTGGFLQDGVYKLQNHPDGAVNPPFYGLRLDKLFGGLGPITFDFEHAQSDMRMRIENGGQTIVIYGQSWGGRDNGTSFDFAGVWDVQFIFDGTVTPAPGDDDLVVTAESDRGTIIPRYTTSHFSANQVFELAPKFANGSSFRLGNEDNDSGHRGFDGISGWGWIQHNGNGTLSHKPTSDWLFTAHPAPDAFENCVELSGINETDANAANNEACVTTPPVDPGANSLSGTVFIDANQDGFLSGGESGQSGVTVNVYRDTNGNGSRDAGEPLFATTVTAGDGTYSVAVPTVGHFVIETDFPGSYPANATLTTDNVEIAFFAGFGLSDTGNDFGFFAPGGGDPDEIDLSLNKTGNAAQVQVGGNITYTLTLTNSSAADVAATGIEVWDVFPNTLIEIQSTTPQSGVTFNNSNGTLKWTVASLAPGASIQLIIVAEAIQEGTAENCAQVGMATGNDTDSTPGNGVGQEDDSDCFTVEITPDPPVTGGSIGDFVFQDANNNGLQDAGEQGLGGILVRLYAGACGPNGAPIALRTTQPNGAYSFTGLPAGDYCVDVRDDTVPFGFVLTTANDPMTVNLSAGEQFDDADFGYFFDPQLTTVDLELVKEVNTSSPALNENVTFTITIRNQGPGVATGVIVRDIIPVGLQFVSSNPSVGSYDPSKLGFWTIGTLAVGQTEVLTITTTVVITNMIENIAQVIAVDQPDIDSTPGNGVPDEDDQDNALVESRGPGAAGDITRAECADIGTINALYYEPNANVVLAGSQVGSVHISNDQGQNWPVAMQSNGGAAVTDIVGLADGSAIFASTFGDGVWRSVDGGETWSKYRLGTNKLTDLDLDEVNNVLYAAADKKVMTVDLGTGATATLPADPFGDQVLSLVYDDANSRLIAASAAAGAWKFESGAWTDVNNGLPIGTINAMIVTPSGMVLAGTNSDGVYVFGGSMWIQFGMGLDNDPIESFGLGGNGELLAGSRESGAYFYNQISGNWESIGNLPIFTVASMAAGAQGEVYAGAPGEGIYLIVDTDFDGIPDMSHQVANFMTNAVIQDMVVDDDGNIWAASFGYGVLFSSDGGNCWSRMNRGLENLWTFAIDRTSDGTLFIGIWADGLGGIWRSTNNGQDWELVGFPTRQIISIAIDPNNEDIVYAGANLSGVGSIVVSSDGGNSWTQLQSFIQPVWAIRIDPANSNHIVVGTLGDGVYESTDAGLTWTQIGSPANGLDDPNGFDLQFGPDGAVYAATNRGVYRYDSVGGFPTNTWTLFGNGSEDYQFRTIEFVGSDIFGGTWNAGLVMYNSLTGDWTDLGLGDIPVIAFAVHELSQTLVIGTEGQGVFLNHNIGQSISTSVENVLVGSELPTSFGLDQNYPNPFASQTTVPFRLVNSEYVNVTVHDMLGREVSTLVDEVLQAGEHHARWTAEGLPSGTYLVRLRAGEHSFTRMVVLMK